MADLGNGVLFLFYNHSHETRYPLNVAISLDGGNAWSAPFCLSKEGDFPTAIATSDGLIHVTYATTGDHRQRVIRHAVIDPCKMIDA